MKISIISPSHKLPEWQQAGFDHYAKRFHHPWSVQLVVPSNTKRHKTASTQQLLSQEAQHIESYLTPSAYWVALDPQGEKLSSETLATKLEQISQSSSQLQCIIGGPDGIAQSLQQQCQQRWSLSPCTFPHGLARILLIEQLYRAVSILHNHPYHRA